MAKKKTPAAPKQVEGELLDAFPAEGPDTGIPASTDKPTQFPTEPTIERTTGKTDGTSRAGSGEAGDTTEATQPANDDRSTDAGKVAITDGSAEILGGFKLTREETQAEATRRWRKEGISERVAAFRDRVREEYKFANPGCKRRDAHDYAWERAMAEFPPAGVEPDFQNLENAPRVEPIPVAPAPIQDDQGVSGLSDLPADWPQLPANAQLQVEIAWVTANRLRVRDGTGVNLAKALSPAPSYSALSWLETSILFPAKFADISVKATADQDSEKEFIKREKLAIEEIRGILAEMLEADES